MFMYLLVLGMPLGHPMGLAHPVDVKVSTVSNDSSK